MIELLEGRLLVTTGDITEMTTDAIVNAANSGLLGGGGVDGAIHRRGGPAILEACREIRRSRYPDGLPAGEAVATTGGKLQARRVIHTVGPIWAGGTEGEERTLASAYRSSLAVAAEERLASVAFPAISTGVYRFPKPLAARVAFRAIREYLTANELPRTVYLVFFLSADQDLFLASIGNLA